MSKLTSKQRFLIIFLLSVIGFWNNLMAQKDTLRNNVFGTFLTMPIEFPVIGDND